MRERRVGRATALTLAVLAAGCLGSPSAPPGPAAPPSPTFGAAVDVGPDRPANEAELVVRPDGSVVVCALRSRSETVLDPYLWRSDDGAAFEAMPHPAGGGRIDCTLGVDAAGIVYYATSTGAALTVAASEDGRSWARSLALGAGSWDRPWIAGGPAGEALVIAWDQDAGGIAAHATRDGGGSWEGPFPAQPAGTVPFETFGNLVWLGERRFAFAFAPLELAGPGLEMHSVWVAVTADGGRTWTFHAVAERLAGNANNILPAMAARDGGMSVSWSERRGDAGAQVWLAHSADGSTWSAHAPLHGQDTTGVLPRVALSRRGPVVGFYLAGGDADPNCVPRAWSFDVVSASGAPLATLAPGRTRRNRGGRGLRLDREHRHARGHGRWLPGVAQRRGPSPHGGSGHWPGRQGVVRVDRDDAARPPHPRRLGGMSRPGGCGGSLRVQAAA